MNPINHATVKRGEFTVPLIGIPAEATQEKCSKCGGSFHMTEMWLDPDGNPICKKCMSTLLIPCPFCGSLEEPEAKHEHIVLDGRHALQCWNCKATGPFTVDENMTASRWNTRQPVWNAK